MGSLLVLLTLSAGQAEPTRTHAPATLAAPTASVPGLPAIATQPTAAWLNGPTAAPPAPQATPNHRPCVSVEAVPYWGHRRAGFFKRFLNAYCDEFGWNGEKKENGQKNGGGSNGDTKNGEAKNGEQKNGETNGAPKNGGQPPQEPERPRRALPAPFPSPPFPTAEYQGFPLIGVPPSAAVYPLMQAIYGGPHGDAVKESRVKAYGWINASGSWSGNRDSNTPSSYWIVPNRFIMNQTVLRLEREADTVQTDHIDWGFRVAGVYGTDYRYFTAGGWGADQLLVNNRLYGWDPTEAHANIYFPGVARGMVLTVGRWIATPDIETQFAPDNYVGTHSLLFTVDISTQTGVLATVMLDEQWTVQAAIHAGADMAPWYAGAIPTGMFGVRWVSEDNNDSFYTVLNATNDARFRYFDLRGQRAGHHNPNIIQTTWQHRFSESCHTKTEAYIMWERDAPVGGTPSIGRFQFNTGGGLGPTVPGTSLTYAVLNYTMFKLSEKDFLTVRNEWVKDENGTRFGFPGNYTSNTVGLTHHFNKLLQIRPEIGYYRNWNNPAFDNGRRKNMVLYGFDVTLRF